MGNVIIGACFRAFLAEVSWLWAPTQRAIFGSNFLGTRLSSESLEHLIGLLAYQEQKLWIKI